MSKYLPTAVTSTTTTTTTYRPSITLRPTQKYSKQQKSKKTNYINEVPFGIRKKKPNNSHLFQHPRDSEISTVKKSRSSSVSGKRRKVVKRIKKTNSPRWRKRQQKKIAQQQQRDSALAQQQRNSALAQQQRFFAATTTTASTTTTRPTPTTTKPFINELRTRHKGTRTKSVQTQQKSFWNSKQNRDSNYRYFLLYFSTKRTVT